MTADDVQGVTKPVSFRTMGSCLRILPEPGFYQGLGVFPLSYWEEGSSSLILATGIEAIVNHPQKDFIFGKLQVCNKHVRLWIINSS